jgi:endonuclease/exonuclease/phosphatase (EEP) superfamily protein YafD
MSDLMRRGLLAVWVVLLAGPLIVMRLPERPYLLDMVAQVAVYGYGGAAVMGLLMLGLRKWSWAAVTCVSVSVFAGMNVGNHWPRVGVASGTPDSAHRDVRVVTFNAGGGLAIDEARFEQWLEDKKIDVVSLVECGEYWHRSPVAECSFRSSGKDGAVVYTRRMAQQVGDWQPRDENGAIKVAIWPDIRILRVQIDDACSCLFMNVYLPSPRTKQRWQTALKSITECARQLPTLRRDGLPIIAAGDFNSTPNGRAYQTFQAVYGIIDACPNIFRCGTIPAWLPLYAGLPIDHIMVSPDVRVIDYQVGPDVGSDHRPVFAIVRVPTEPPPVGRNPIHE